VQANRGRYEPHAFTRGLAVGNKRVAMPPSPKRRRTTVRENDGERTNLRPDAARRVVDKTSISHEEFASLQEWASTDIVFQSASVAHARQAWPAKFEFVSDTAGVLNPSSEFLSFVEDVWQTFISDVVQSTDMFGIAVYAVDSNGRGWPRPRVVPFNATDTYVVDHVAKNSKLHVEGAPSGHAGTPVSVGTRASTTVADAPQRGVVAVLKGEILPEYIDIDAMPLQVIVTTAPTQRGLNSKASLLRPKAMFINSMYACMRHAAYHNSRPQQWLQYSADQSALQMAEHNDTVYADAVNASRTVGADDAATDVMANRYSSLKRTATRVQTAADAHDKIVMRGGAPNSVEPLWRSNNMYTVPIGLQLVSGERATFDVKVDELERNYATHAAALFGVPASVLVRESSSSGRSSGGGDSQDTFTANSALRLLATFLSSVLTNVYVTARPGGARWASSADGDAIPQRVRVMFRTSITMAELGEGAAQGLIEPKAAETIMETNFGVRTKVIPIVAPATPAVATQSGKK